MTDHTTDLQTVRQEPKRFSWGTVVKIHDVGNRYTIIEYLTPDNSPRTLFHVYVSGESTSTSTNTFDGALLLAIAWAHGNGTNLAAYFAAKILDVKE